jgi:nitroreductase
MELKQAIQTRRSIRAYQARTISAAVIRRLLDLARYAPSSLDGQPWHFIVVTEPKIKAKLVKLKNRFCPVEKQMYRADFMGAAPAVIVVCVDKQRSFNRDIENGVLVTATLMLAAHGEGLGSVYLSAYRTDKPGLAAALRRLLRLPARITPVTIVPLGYADETPEPKAMRALAEMIHYEQFRRVP